ncbi:antibiotic biosynthesis monooxygenase [Salinicoccus sp. HZC-1]|uniref:antibiotic biosynthesis monooxygenase n=1 Tax=Salinicoccus sp. HZC-1 TaxID=3385497 RepID=UPI00398AF0A7
MTMIKAVNVLKIEKGKVDEVIEKFQEPKAVHTFDGFVLMEVLRTENTEEYDELQICTTWEERANFEAWRESRATKKAHAAEKGGDNKKPENSPILGAELQTYEVVIQHHPAK